MRSIYSFVTMVVCIVVGLVFMSCSLMLSGFVLMFLVYLVLLSLGVASVVMTA